VLLDLKRRKKYKNAEQAHLHRRVPRVFFAAIYLFRFLLSGLPLLSMRAEFLPDLLPFLELIRRQDLFQFFFLVRHQGLALLALLFPGKAGVGAEFLSLLGFIFHQGRYFGLLVWCQVKLRAHPIDSLLDRSALPMVAGSIGGLSGTH
jgi:hypothetical protein